MTEPTIDEMLEWLTLVGTVDPKMANANLFVEGFAYDARMREAIRAILENLQVLTTSDSSGEALFAREEARIKEEIDRVNRRIKNERTND